MARRRLLVILAFAIVVLCFVAATTYSSHQLLRIDRTVDRIARSGLPGIATLTSLRRTLSQVGVTVQQMIDEAEEGRQVGHARTDRLRRELAASLASYRALPMSSQELDSFEEVRQRLRAVDASTDRTLERIAAADFPGARSRVFFDLLPSIQAADGAILQLILLKVASVQTMAAGIVQIRHHSMMFAFFLDGLSVILAALAAVLAFRIIGRYTRLVEQRAEELELFAGRVAHDVLSPLTSVSLTIDSCERHPSDPRNVQQVARARSSLRHVKQIVDALLTFASAGARPPADAHADLPEVVRGVLDDARMAAESGNIELAVASSEPAQVRCQPGALHSILANLVNNAIKSLGEAKVKRVTVEWRRRGDCICTEVIDTGFGLRPEERHRLFEPHVRPAGSGRPGIGLGLATVRRIVEAHGGRVGVFSEPGRGARFWFELPQAPASSPQT